MNSGSSASITSGSHSAGASAMASWYQRSRPSVQAMSPPVRLTTRQVCTLGVCARASSAWALRCTRLPPRRPSSAVISTWQSASRMRSRSASGEKPPNTTEWMAPMRAQASMAAAASGIMGM